mgnify:CR=1 FL=1
MPELPEVETIRRQLRPLVVGRRILKVWLDPQAPRLAVSPPHPQGLVQSLEGRRILDLTRHGKYLLFALDDGRTWVVHLRMTGSLIHRPGPCQGPFLRAAMALDDGSHLCYRDQRKLGRMWLVDDPSQVVGHLGPEPLDPKLTPHGLWERIKGRRTAIKAVLLDQRAIAGVGNIYADEVLFVAGIHPRRPASSLSLEEAERLLTALRVVLEGAIRHGGTTFLTYLDATGAPGSHGEHVRVFRREGKPCLRCQGTISRIKIGGRTTYFCPACQQ